MSDSDLLTKGDLIKSRWRVINKIGGGGFGQIYQAYDKLRRELVAVKVESTAQVRQGIRMEMTVLRRLRNREHACELLAGGISTLYNYMVITLLGASLSELRKKSPEQCFTLSTSLRISLQILNAIETIHSIGFLHRDIKPSNFAIGKNDLRQIYILDFGLARKFTDYDQHVRPARIEAGFRGTIRYASINAHNNRELGRHDDLWSFFYMLIEFLIGYLPWSKVKDKENVGRMKETYDHTRFLVYLPDEFNKFLDHITNLCYEDKPNYEFLRSLITLSIQRLGYRDGDRYDWEKLDDSLVKFEQEKPSFLDHQQNSMLDNGINTKQYLPLLQTPSAAAEQINPSDFNLPAEHQTNGYQLPKPSSNETYYSPHKRNGEFKHTNIPQQNPEEFDQQNSADTKLWSPSRGRLTNTLIKHTNHLNTIERSPPATNGLLTYISQQFSNAAAPGTPSLFSQWSHHHAETYTDDDLLKRNKSYSSKIDERATTVNGKPMASIRSQLHHVQSSINTEPSVRDKFTTLSPNNMPDDENNVNNNQKHTNYAIPFSSYTKKSLKTTSYFHQRQQISSANDSKNL